MTIKTIFITGYKNIILIRILSDTDSHPSFVLSFPPSSGNPVLKSLIASTDKKLVLIQHKKVIYNKGAPGPLNTILDELF